jgi:hypothetical protein
MERQLLTNLQLLGYDVRKASLDFNIVFHEEMFAKPPVKVFESVLHFLLCIIDPKVSSTSLAPHYPCLDRNAGRSFRKAALDMTTSLEKEGRLPSHTLRASDMQTCVGKRIVVAFWRLSVLALQYVLKRDFAESVLCGISSFAAEDILASTVHVSPSAIALRCRLEALAFLAKCAEWNEKQNVWNETAQRWTLLHRNLSQQLISESGDGPSSRTTASSFDLSVDCRNLVSDLDRLRKCWQEILDVPPEERKALNQGLDGSDQAVLQPVSSLQSLSEAADLRVFASDYKQTLMPLLNSLAPALQKGLPKLISLDSQKEKLSAAQDFISLECERHASYKSSMESFRSGLADMTALIHENIAGLKRGTTPLNVTPMTRRKDDQDSKSHSSQPTFLPPTPTDLHGDQRSAARDVGSTTAPLTVARSNRRVWTARDLENFEERSR